MLPKTGPIRNQGAYLGFYVTTIGTTTPFQSGALGSSGAVAFGMNVTNSSTQLDIAGAATIIGVCHSNSDANDEFIVDCSGAPSDLAEWYEVKGEAEAGDVLVASDESFTYQETQVDPNTGTELPDQVTTTISKLQKGTMALRNKIIGIVSTSPNQIMGEDVKEQGSNPKPVALNGRVPVKIAASSEAINAGDLLTVSDIAGRATKATTAGQMIGKALESWTPNSGKDKIMVFVSTSYADPNDLLAGLSLDLDGNLILPSSDPEDEIVAMGGTPPPAPKKDLAWTLSDIVRRITNLESANPNASSSGALASDATSPASSGLNATASARLDALSGRVDIVNEDLSGLKLDHTALRDRVASLEGDLALLASGSAALNPTPEASSSAELGLDKLDANDVAITNSLSVGGRTTLADVGITGRMNIGLIAIEGLSENGFGTINTTSGPLKLQSDGFNGVDILDGKVVIEANGNMKVDGTVTVKKLNVDTEDVAGASIGEATIPAGETGVTVDTAALTSKSKIFVTPIDSPVATAAKKTGTDTFDIKISTPQLTDLKLNWWIVN